MNKTYKFRLYPTKKQIEKFTDTLDICRILYNSCLLDRKKYYGQNNKGLSRNEQSGVLTNDKERIEFLTTVYSQVLQEVLIRVDKAFENFFRRVKEKKSKSEKKLIAKQRQLDKKKKRSENRKKARLELSKLHRKVKNQRSDFLHKVSRNLVNYGFIAVEDLNIQNMIKNHNLAKSILDVSWSKFFNYLDYKAAEAGSQVVRVNPKNTTIDCSRCGYLVPKTLAVRTHSCPNCGLVLDRDHNAAINILNKSTVGTTECQAWGDWMYQNPSMNQEAQISG